MDDNNNRKALKSGVWYTAANFLMKSIGFITTPFFTRLLSHSDFGYFSNYTAWLSVLTVFATLNLTSSFISARFDYEKDFDGYISSTLVLSSVATCVCACIINVCADFFSTLTEIDIKYLNIMMVYLLLFSAVDMFQARERYYFEYKVSVAISLLVSISTAVFSVILVMFMEDRLFGRIVGSVVPTIVVGLILYGLIISRYKKINIAYWKYALPISLPFIPHLLSLFLLNSLDKMMITKTCGTEDNALYSVAYTCGTIITLLITSMNTAFAPWLGEKLNGKAYHEIREVSKTYISLFAFGACGVVLFTPELLLFMGGHTYMAAAYVMPPVAFGCVCQFIYTMYVNVEQFSKHTIGMAFASMAAALSNFILNYIFIPRFGYLAAAYTTLASFLLLLIIHMLIVKKIGLHMVYPTKLIIEVLMFMCAYTAFVNVILLNNCIRYTIIALYTIVSIILVIKRKNDLMAIVKRN